MFCSKGCAGYDPQPEEPIFESIMRQYGAVVAQSLVQSFGLDGLLVHDRYGGDVDTVHNVCQYRYGYADAVQKRRQ